MIEVRIIGEPDATRRDCFDCHHMQAAVSWWCKSKEACAHHGTNIPGRSGCQFWSPCKPPSIWDRIGFTDVIIMKQMQVRTMKEPSNV